jgi:hypothetical protein
VYAAQDGERDTGMQHSRRIHWERGLGIINVCGYFVHGCLERRKLMNAIDGTEFL